jgi:hypothetical protein
MAGLGVACRVGRIEGKSSQNKGLRNLDPKGCEIPNRVVTGRIACRTSAGNVGHAFMIDFKSLLSGQQSTPTAPDSALH